MNRGDVLMILTCVYILTMFTCVKKNTSTYIIYIYLDVLVKRNESVNGRCLSKLQPVNCQYIYDIEYNFFSFFPFFFFNLFFPLLRPLIFLHHCSCLLNTTSHSKYICMCTYILREEHLCQVLIVQLYL